MLNDGTILRLFVSQAFAVYFVLLIQPLKKPGRKSLILVFLGWLVITSINALLIAFVGISFYIRFYLLTLTLPYIALGLCFSAFKDAKFIFVILTTQLFANVAVTNGLLASYLFFGEDNPFIDTAARVLTYLIFLPIIIKFIRPTYIKMTEVIKKGWWILNGALIMSYALTYFILFVPDTVFNRPENFYHAYIGIALSLLIFVIIFYLFIEIQTKTKVEQDKQLLSTQVSSLKKETAAITNIAFYDSLTGLKNRYSLYKQMNEYIQVKQEFLVIFIDLDNLKKINDTYYHSAGDDYLKQFAKALQYVVNNKGDVYRFAGDEFICLLTDTDDSFDSNCFKKAVAEDMVMEEPYYGISLGLARYPEDGLDPDDLIKLADREMYLEKRTKRKAE
ncbi:MAG: diguanylate cyclase [Clostridia bacterium]|jgi:diguanylate cyclase (GGDEF)-like protein